MRAVVVGGGISGLACAIALGQRGWRVDVLERAPAPRTEGFTIDFYGPGYDAAGALGVLDELRSRGRVYETARYVDVDGRPRGELPIAAFVRVRQGRYFSIPRGSIEAGLRAALPTTAQVRYGATATVLEPGDETHPARVDTAGERIEADLVLACDGLHSRTRAVGTQIRHLGYLTSAFTVHDPALARELGNVVQLSDTLDRQVGAYTVGEDGVSALLVAPGGPELPDDRTAWIRTRMQGAFPIADRLAKAMPADLYLDQVAQSIAPSWRNGRVLGMGDAAHAVSLVAGQGASLAIAGADALGRAIDAAPSLPAALDAYELAWRPVVEREQERGRRMAAGFVPRRNLERRVRRIMLGAARFPPIGRALAAAAAGTAATHGGAQSR